MLTARAAPQVTAHLRERRHGPWGRTQQRVRRRREHAAAGEYNADRRQAGVAFMIESIMFFTGGFLVAGLLALILISFVHHRAVRLTRRRLEDAIPVSMAEIQADKDNLRAEFAMSARRLELSVEQLKAKATSQLGEIARKTEAINRLKAELAEKTAITDDLDARAKSLGNRIRSTEQEYQAKIAAVEANERALAAKEAELTKAASELNEQRLTSDTHRVELAVLKTQSERFKAQIDDARQEAEDAARRLVEQRVAATAIAKELEEKRQALDTLRPQLAQLEREIATHTNELENRARRIDELEARNREQERMLGEGAAAFNELRQQRELDVAAVQQELAARYAEHRSTAEQLHNEKSTLESNLADANNMIASYGDRIDSLEKRLAERERLIMQRDDEVRSHLDALAVDRQAHDADVERLQADKQSLDGLLQTANNTIASHSDRIDSLEQQLAERERLIMQRDDDIRSHLDALAVERQAHEADVERLQADKQSLNRLMQTANRTLDTRGERIDHLEARLAERDELLRQCEAEIKSQMQELTTLKSEAATATTRTSAEIEQLETLLRGSTEDRRVAQLELAAIKHEAETTWKSERVESALLRERINDIAAQVAHMALAMDKSGSIATVLTQAPRADDHEDGPNGEPSTAPPGDLTARIRKLQGAVSRVSTAS
jgi:chromosome segregation ATPase